MKTFLALVIFATLFLSPNVRADGPDDQYVVLYTFIQQGDSLSDKGETTQAMSKYSDALSSLKQFQKNNPDWNPKVVKFRIKYLEDKINQLSLVTPTDTKTNSVVISTPSPTPTASSSPVAAPIPAPTPAPAATTNVPAVTTNAPMTPAPVVETAEPPKPVTPTVSPETDNRIKNLEEHIRSLSANNTLLQAKLKEALAAQPAAIDPNELLKAREDIRALQKQNDLLQTSLDAVKTNKVVVVQSPDLKKTQQALAEATQKAAQLAEANAILTTEKEVLQTKLQSLPGTTDPATAALRDENAILKKQVADLQTKTAGTTAGAEAAQKLKAAQAQVAALQSDKEILQQEKQVLENHLKQTAVAPAPIPAPVVMTDNANAEKIAALEAQRDALQKSLETATKEIAGRKKGKETASQIDDLTKQIGTLRARIEVLEAMKTPYTAEELALLSRPEVSLMATARSSAHKKPKDLPAGAAVLLAEAKRYFVTQDYDKAEAKYREVLKLDDKNVTTLSDLASIELQTGRLDEAEKNLNAAISVDPNDDYSLFILGQLKFSQKKYDEAFESLSQAAQLNPQNAKVQNFLGLTLSEKGLRGPAETAFRKAIQYDPGFAEAHLNLAVVYVTQQPPLVELARWHYQKALTIGHAPNPALENLLNSANKPKPADH